MAAFFFSAVFLTVAGQTTPIAGSLSDQRSDALTFLKEVCRRYEHLGSYHIESIEERQTKSDLARDWHKSLTSAVVAPGNRYRFERHEEGIWWIQISDGNNEWIYQPDAQQYTQEPAPASGPSRFRNPYYTFQMLNFAQEMPKNLARWPNSIRSADYLSDESIELNGNLVNCYVIKAQAKDRRSDVTTELTFWIDAGTKAIRKIHDHSEGAIIMNEPYAHMVSDRLVLYTVADLDGPSVPDSSFVFNPPPTAKLVKDFEDPLNRSSGGIYQGIVGKVAPPINLHSADGTTVSLKSFEGKPILLDFWATWCPPCLDSIPLLERIYRETSSRGLVMLSIDEDETAKVASDYLTEHKAPWSNFHSTDDIAAAYPHSGIPYLVLVDGSGKIVFAGSEVEELRVAVTKLGPEFASSTNPAKP